MTTASAAKPFVDQIKESKELNYADLMEIIAACHAKINKSGFHPGRSVENSPRRATAATG